MTKLEIIALARKWEAKAERAEDRYQQSGESRHLREKERAEDLAAALWIAADAEDEHDTLISMRMSLNQLASKAHGHLDSKYTGQEGCRDSLVDLACEVIAAARLYGVDSVLPPSKTPRLTVDALQKEGS